MRYEDEGKRHPDWAARACTNTRGPDPFALTRWSGPRGASI